MNRSNVQITVETKAVGVHLLWTLVTAYQETWTRWLGLVGHRAYATVLA